MPLWLIKIGNAIKVVGTWLKGNWLLLLLLIGMTYALLLAKNKTALHEQLMREFRDQQERNRKDLEELRKIQHEHIQRQLEIERKYQEVISKIEKEYQDQLLALTSDKEKRLRIIIAQNNDDPNIMANEINNLLGIPLYSTTSN